MMSDRARFTATAPPAAEPVTITELRSHLRIDGADDDAQLLALLIAAREHVETYLGRPVLPTAMRAEIEAWPEGGRLLLDAPVLSVGAVVVTAPSGADAPWTDYLVRPGPGGTRWLRPATGAAWPALPDDAVIRIDITAGWAADRVPESVKAAIMQIAGTWYLARESVNIGNITGEIPDTGRALLKPLRWRLIG